MTDWQAIVADHGGVVWRTAYRLLGNTAEAEFTIIVAAASLNPDTGYVGTEVTVSGTGFKASQSVTISFENEDTFEDVATASTDVYGSVNASFTVPVRNTGTFKVKVSDGVNTDEADFTILTSASLSQTTGNVGTELTVSGTGFAGKVSIKYDDVEIATTTADAEGAFSVTFTAPQSKYGGHNITATDGTSTEQFTFTMESTPPSIPPPLLPEMDIKAKAQAYFDWEDVTDPSGVTYVLQIASDENFIEESIVLEKTALTDSEYTITKEEKLESVSKKAPYYWRVKAIDDASNEGDWSGTGSFYVGVSFTMPQWAIYTLSGIGALLLVFLGFWVGRKTAYYSY